MPESLNIVQDKIDTRIFNELKEASIPFRFLVETLPPPWENLVQDMFATYYKVNPMLRKEEDLSFAGLANRPYIEKVLESNETQVTRAYTMLDELASALATIKAGETLKEEIENRESLKKIQEKTQQVAQEDNPDPQQMQEIQDEMNAAAKDVRRAVRSALDAGKKESEDVQVVLNSWGIQPGELKTMPLGGRLNLVERLRTPKLKRIGEMIGRMRNIARERQKQKLSKQRDELHSITIGNNLAYTLPAELAALKNPIRKKDFLRRLMEGQVLEYELTAKEKQGRGPIIVLLDCSGSMAGGRYDWALAVTAALVDTADRQKRKSVVVVFDTQIKKEVLFDVKDTKKKLLDLLMTGADGGTSFEIPLDRSLELLETSAYKKADIVMITDGECEVPEEFKTQFLQTKKRKEFRLWSILIDARPSQIQEISDKAWAVASMSDEVAGELFQEVY